MKRSSDIALELAEKLNVIVSVINDEEKINANDIAQLRSVRELCIGTINTLNSILSRKTNPHR